MIDFFINTYKNVSLGHIIIEFFVFVFGILSVWYAKQENVLVYPVGLIATALSAYLFFYAGYLGDMMVNIYFSVMSIYGWHNWLYGKSKDEETLIITITTVKEKIIGVGLFFITIFLVLGIYNYFEYEVNNDNYVDIIASGIFFTAMWYMAKKKIENWALWIIGNLIVIPLYAYRGLGMLSLQYLIFTILAILAYLEWKKTLNNKKQQ